jgi:hypothetical protein
MAMSTIQESISCHAPLATGLLSSGRITGYLPANSHGFRAPGRTRGSCFLSTLAEHRVCCSHIMVMVLLFSASWCTAAPTGVIGYASVTRATDSPVAVPTSWLCYKDAHHPVGILLFHLKNPSHPPPRIVHLIFPPSQEPITSSTTHRPPHLSDLEPRRRVINTSIVNHPIHRRPHRTSSTTPYIVDRTVHRQHRQHHHTSSTAPYIANNTAHVGSSKYLEPFH